VYFRGGIFSFVCLILSHFVSFVSFLGCRRKDCGNLLTNFDVPVVVLPGTIHGRYFQEDARSAGGAIRRLFREGKLRLRREVAEDLDIALAENDASQYVLQTVVGVQDALRL
jgi:hypothetical protein